MSEEPKGTGKHLDEMTLLLYVERQMERSRGLEVSAHVQECEVCRTLLHALERESRLLTRAMLEEDEPLPSRLAQFQERARQSMHWVWGLMFGLAATGIYAFYTSYVELWQKQLEDAGLGGSNLLDLLIFQGTIWKGWQSVITLFEVVAMLTLAGLAAIFFRRKIRRGSALAMVFAGFCTVLAMPTGASATEFRNDKRVTVASDQVIHSDLYATGGSIRIDGTVEGDLVAAGGEIQITGHVTGDVISSSGALRVTGQVDGSIRSYAGNIQIKGKVGHNLMVFGGDINIDRDAQIGGSLTSFTGRCSVDGNVAHDLLMFTGEVSLTGNVGGSAKIQGGELNIDSSATVKGPITFKGDKEPEVSSQAKLSSPVQFTKWKHGPDYASAHYYVWQVIWASAYILFGIVLMLLMPGLSKDAVRSTERYGASWGLGILAGFGLPIGACVACATVVGLFLGLATLALWYGTLYFGQVIIGALIGQWLMGRTNETWPLIGRMAVGVVLLRVFSMIPHAGWVFKYGAAFWGLGALALEIYKRFEPVVGQNTPSAPYAPSATVGGAVPA